MAMHGYFWMKMVCQLLVRFVHALRYYYYFYYYESFYCSTYCKPAVHLRNDLYCVGWGIKLYSLTHCKPKQPGITESKNGIKTQGILKWMQRQANCLGFTVPDTYAESHIGNTATGAGAAANQAAANKIAKYDELAIWHIFYPVARETGGTWNYWAVELAQEIGRRATLLAGEPRESTFLFQQLSIALQREMRSTQHFWLWLDAIAVISCLVQF